MGVAWATGSPRSTSKCSTYAAPPSRTPSDGARPREQRRSCGGPRPRGAAWCCASGLVRCGRAGRRALQPPPTKATAALAKRPRRGARCGAVTASAVCGDGTVVAAAGPSPVRPLRRFRLRLPRRYSIGSERRGRRVRGDGVGAVAGRRRGVAGGGRQRAAWVHIGPALRARARRPRRRRSSQREYGEELHRARALVLR
ncbi:hypothetical protein M885DRAFT_517851 [Pelagophyceae sp. CCMP2097]|nr:hypothetical protein M885DRAFT_517851 [Pelagophyceae sp. CCMP2097]